ncbi:MAG: hypothetical protein ACE5JU_22695, partial [Candidatus Binatia bacterium]
MGGWPIYYRNLLQLGNLASEVGIITLWTNKDLVRKSIPSENYAALGQLYSTDEGLSALLRNCLANKRIRHLIVVGSDITSTGQALIELAHRGIDNSRVIGTENTTLHKEIPLQAINNFRTHVQVHDFRHLKNFSELNKVIEQLPRLGPYGEPEKFPEGTVEPPERFPADPSGYLVRKRFIGDAWLEMLFLTMRFGWKATLQEGGEDQKEIFNLTTVIIEEDMRNPKWHEYYPFTKHQLTTHIEKFAQQFENENEHASSVLADWETTLQKVLREDAYSRKAVTTFLGHNSDIAPNIVIVQAMAQPTELGPKIFLRAEMRATEVYDEWLQQAYGLRNSQIKLVQSLRADCGSLTINCASSAVSRRNWTKVKAILEENPQRLKRTGDSRGNFLVALKANSIEVTHQNPQGST